MEGLAINRRDTEFGRREFLLGSGILAMVGTLGNRSAQGKALPGDAASVTFVESFNAETVSHLADAARRCVITAQACIDHFANDLGLDASDSHQCAGLDKAVIAICGAVASLASIESSYVASIAVTAMEICEACEQQCNARKDHQSCVDCAKACRSFIDKCHRATVTADYHL